MGTALVEEGGGSCPPAYRVGPSPRGIVGKGCVSPLPYSLFTQLG